MTDAKPKLSLLTKRMPHDDHSRMDKPRCYRCGKPIRQGTGVVLEMCCLDNSFHIPGTLPESESQGCWDFGPDCGAIVMREYGLTLATK